MKRQAWIALAALGLGCSDEKPGRAPGDASADAPVTVFEAAPIVVPPILCGTNECSQPEGSGPLEGRACCLPEGACGVAPARLGGRCVPLHQAGSVDLSCPEELLPGGVGVQGCCTPGGRCGLFDRQGELGCVAPPDGVDARQCAPAPGADCTSVVELPCDGPEDCSAGLVCCGRTQGDIYDRFGCFESCETLSNGPNGLWREICHPGGACRNDRYSCSATSELPAFLVGGRCIATSTNTGVSEAGPGLGDDAASAVPSVRCGDASCAAGEKCCLRGGHLPYCTGVSSGCLCVPEVNASEASD